MVKLACNEQCITLHPLRGHYLVGPFPANVIFRPSQSPFILGLISSIRLLTAPYCHFLLVGQIQAVVTSARLWSINTLGRFHSVIKYGLLTMARYGHTTRISPIDDMARRRPIVSMARRRPIVSTPVEGPLFLWPVEGLLFLRPVEGPLFLQPVGGPVSLQ